MKPRTKTAKEATALPPWTEMCKREGAKEAREFLTTVGNKWNISLIVMLSRSPNNRARFTELQTMLDGISQRMLTNTLRNLERDGLLVREAFAEIPPRVEYQLTELGLELIEQVRHLLLWILGSWDSISKARENFISR
jgi:DNA-binding HxlR family transcriptional regulator